MGSQSVGSALVLPEHRPPNPDLLERISPPGMRQCFEDLMMASRPDLGVLFRLFGWPRILEWIHCIGVHTEDELRQLVPPLPPRELREMVGPGAEELFLWSGLIDMSRCLELFEKHGAPGSAEGAAILDFGCGCGRLTRHLVAYQRLGRLHAVDVNPRLVGWCGDHLTDVEAIVNQPSPPLPHDDGRFHLVYSLSVFTHLPATAVDLWLKELHRVLAPGGLLVLSTHGPRALQILEGSPRHREICYMDHAEVLRVQQQLQQEGLIFLSYSPETLALAAAGPDYGTTFMHPDHIRSNWPRHQFDVVEQVPGAIRSWQDLVVLRKKTPTRAASV